MDEFKKELWDYIWDCGIDVRGYIRKFYTDLRDSSLEYNDSDILYHMAYELACLTKGLPPHLHARMVLVKNEWTKKYIELHKFTYV